MSTELAERIAGAVLAHPAVVGLDAGPYGAIASYLPGRRVDGVRIAEDDSAVELAITVEFGQQLPSVARQLRAMVREVAGDVRVDVTIVDLVQVDLAQVDLAQAQRNLEDSR